MSWDLFWVICLQAMIGGVVLGLSLGMMVGIMVSILTDSTKKKDTK